MTQIVLASTRTSSWLTSTRLPFNKYNRGKPFKPIQIDGETVVIQTSRGQKIFRSSFVKPMVCSKVNKPYNMNIPCDGNVSIDLKIIDEDFVDEKARTLISNITQDYKLTGQVVNDQENNRREFAKSRREEIQGIFRNGTFAVVKTDDTREWTRIVGSQFMDIIKPTNVRAWSKSRLVALSYGDKETRSISTKSSTV